MAELLHFLKDFSNLGCLTRYFFCPVFEKVRYSKS